MMFWQTIIVLLISTTIVSGQAPSECTPAIPTIPIYCDIPFNVSWTTSGISTAAAVEIRVFDNTSLYDTSLVFVGLDGAGNSTLVVPCSTMESNGFVITNALTTSYFIIDSGNSVITTCITVTNNTVTSCGNGKLETTEECDNSTLAEPNCNNITCQCDTGTTGNGTCFQSPPTVTPTSNTTSPTKAPPKPGKIVIIVVIVVLSIVLIIVFVVLVRVCCCSGSKKCHCKCASSRKDECKDKWEFESGKCSSSSSSSSEEGGCSCSDDHKCNDHTSRDNTDHSH